MRKIKDMSIEQFALDMIGYTAVMPVSYDMREQLQRSATKLNLLCNEFIRKSGTARIRVGGNAVSCCNETKRYLTLCHADRSLVVLVDFFSYRIRNGIAAERKLLKFAAQRKKG